MIIRIVLSFITTALVSVLPLSAVVPGKAVAAKYATISVHFRLSNLNLDVSFTLSS